MQGTFISTQVFNFLQLFHIVSIQILIKLFFSNIITDLPYDLNKYIQYKHVWKLFGEVVYIYTLWLPSITWIGMKSCSKFCVT